MYCLAHSPKNRDTFISTFVFIFIIIVNVSFFVFKDINMVTTMCGMVAYGGIQAPSVDQPPLLNWQVHKIHFLQ